MRIRGKGESPPNPLILICRLYGGAALRICVYPGNQYSTGFQFSTSSLRIANIMAERMDGLLLSMSKYKGTKCSSRQIGLVFPAYFWDVPRTVAEFADEMKVEADNPYVFAAATCGGLAGGVLGHMDALLKKKGLHLDYGVTIPSVANVIEEYNPKTRSADRKLREADEMAERASAEVIAARRNGPFGFHV